MHSPATFLTVICSAALLSAGDAVAQSNFTLFLGGSAIRNQPGAVPDIGGSIGLIAKFNVLEHLRLRAQTNVDKIQRRDIVTPGFAGRESLTMVCFGFGLEGAIGSRDLDLFANVTPHGTIRTAFRSQDLPDGSVHVGDLTRFSIGLAAGAGFEVFITDNIGFEMQAQYDIFNFDFDSSDPINRGLRAAVGLQFYLGRNFSR